MNGNKTVEDILVLSNGDHDMFADIAEAIIALTGDKITITYQGDGQFIVGSIIRGDVISDQFDVSTLVEHAIESLDEDEAIENAQRVLDVIAPYFHDSRVDVKELDFGLVDDDQLKRYRALLVAQAEALKELLSNIGSPSLDLPREMKVLSDALNDNWSFSELKASNLVPSRIDCAKRLSAVLYAAEEYELNIENSVCC